MQGWRSHEPVVNAICATFRHIMQSIKVCICSIRFSGIISNVLQLLTI